ncbi:uncharacterized protein LOC134844978 [Symsagittifera roscoffensis]|uniref:uncharacterized protein LOC134844978 n=1 Tax=Symsagittifera roscoffensis TaxID=84072 RepID=UPI00307BEC51
MNTRRFCRKNATAIQFAILFCLLFYLIYHLKNIKIKKDLKYGQTIKHNQNPSEDNVYKNIENGPGDGEKKGRGHIRTDFGLFTLPERIQMSTDYILRQIKSDNSFIYRVNMNKNVHISESYNLLRHAGTIYSLATINEEFPSTSLEDAITKTASWLISRLEPVKNNDNVLAVWSKYPETKMDDQEAKLGGAGLSLVAFTKAQKISQSLISVETMEKIAAFIESMQKPSGQFSSKLDKNSAVTSFISLYYPGEACLGLTMFHQLTREEKWFTVALKAMKYLASQRESQAVGEVLPDHWALIATRELLKSDLLRPVDRDMLIKHALKVSTKLISEQKRMPGEGRVKFSFDSNGGLSPTCTRLEGLLAIMHQVALIIYF